MARFSIVSLVLSLGLAVSGANIQVQVGQTGLTYDPETINAQPGDTVTYNFHPKNHSVTQSSFAEPCKPLAGGFFSGFVPTQDLTAASRTTFTITVNDTNPIWVYCAQTAGNHCQAGMVHAINAKTTGNTIDAFKLAANKTATPSTFPPDGLPVGGLRKTSVDVGLNGTLSFSSNNITELPRTVIEFSFNPKNHSVVQSSFADPCHSLSTGGFSSGFIPTAVSPSGATFQIVLNDTKPVWFYCAQTTKTHCQAGMVGSINAPTVGNTLQAFIDKAATQSESTIPPFDPIGGILTVNGTVITTLNGAVLGSSETSDSASSTATMALPPPGSTIPPVISSMAGGSPPSNYSWAPSITDTATDLLQLINFIDNILVQVLDSGYNNLTDGGWSHLYPDSIRNTIGSMSAQAIVHRSTATDSLQHYQKTIMSACTYNFPISSVDDFVHVTLTLILLEIALLLDVVSLVVLSDTWMVAPLASTLGSKARMAGMVNMMQNHIPAAAPREVVMPAEFVYSYLMHHYVQQGSCKQSPPYNVIAPMTLTPAPMNAGRVNNVTISYTPPSGGSLSMAWLGAWGSVEYAPVVGVPNTSGQWTAAVPGDLSGHVWGVLTNGTGASLSNLPSIAVAGPEIVWVTQPS